VIREGTKRWGTWLLVAAGACLGGMATVPVAAMCLAVPAPVWVGPVSFPADVGWRRQSFRGGLRARSASTVKTVLMMAYLRRREVRRRGLTGSEKGLLGAMIRRSDNGAVSTIRDRVGARAIIRLARRTGMTDFIYGPIWGICRVSARGYARFMRLLPGPVPRRHRRRAVTARLGHPFPALGNRPPSPARMAGSLQGWLGNQ